MKKFVKKTVTSEITVCEEQCCDLCGTKASKPDHLWQGGTYDIDETEIEVTVRQKEGSSYPEGGVGTEIIIDLCPACFKNRLVPGLRSQGAKIEERDWDW